MIHRLEWLKMVSATSLSKPAKLVALALAVHFYNDETGQCNPSLEKIGDVMALSLSAVKRAVKELDEDGWLERDGNRGRGRSNQYALRLPPGVVPIRRQKPAESSSENRPTSGPLTANPEVRKQPTSGPAPSPKVGQPIENILREHSMARARDDDWGCPVPHLKTIRADEADRITDWNVWLYHQGFPPLDEVGAAMKDKDGPGFYVPLRFPPDKDRDRNGYRDCCAFFRWTLDRKPKSAEVIGIGRARA